MMKVYGKKKKAENASIIKRLHIFYLTVNQNRFPGFRSRQKKGTFEASEKPITGLDFWRLFCCNGPVLQCPFNQVALSLSSVCEKCEFFSAFSY